MPLQLMIIGAFKTLFLLGYLFKTVNVQFFQLMSRVLEVSIFACEQYKFRQQRQTTFGGTVNLCTESFFDHRGTGRGGFTLGRISTNPEMKKVSVCRIYKINQRMIKFSLKFDSARTQVNQGGQLNKKYFKHFEQK